MANKLRIGLILPNFPLEHREDPPFDLTVSCETLGFELWLNSETLDGYNFALEMQTELSHEEMFSDRMHDLSLWMARFITKMCDVETCVFTEKGAVVMR